MRLGIPGPGGRSTILLLALAWLAVVVAVAGLTWQVIDSAGRDVLTADDPPLSATGSTSDGSTRSARPSPREDQSPSRSPRPSDPGSPGTVPTDPTTTPSTEPSSPRPSPSSTPPPQPAQAQVRSWQGSAGSVSASCTGASIALQSATPYDGWTVEVDDRGPGRVRVEFTSGGEDERETEVEAVCSGGAPRFEVESND